MEIPEKIENEVKKRLCMFLSESENGAQNMTISVIDIDRHTYIDCNLKTYGASLGWITEKGGFKRQVWREDTSKIWGDNHISIDVDGCRICGHKRKPYPEIFYQVHKEDSGGWYKVYAYDNGYCKECAEAMGKQIRVSKPAPRLLRKSEQKLTGDRYPTIIYEFDGFRMESNEIWNKSK